MTRRPAVVTGSLFLLLAIFVALIPNAHHSQAKAEPTPLASAGSSLHPVEQFTATPAQKTLIDAFAANNVPYFSEDRVTAFPDPSLGLGSVITVERALPIAVKDGKRTHVYRTWQDTTGALLAERLIQLGQEDRVNFADATPLASGMTIEITRVARTIVTEMEKIPAKTVERENDQVWRGEKKTTQQGKDGKREKKFLVIREDGELVSKTLQSNTIVEAVVDKIIEIGTKLKIGQVFSGKATYYENNLGTKVATDKFKRGVELRVTNLSNGKSIIVRNDGCICGATGVLIDLNPAYFKQLGGTLGQGVLQNIRVEEILN